MVGSVTGGHDELSSGTAGYPVTLTQIHSHRLCQRGHAWLGALDRNGRSALLQSVIAAEDRKI